jgi:type I restriction enzyme S subunit
VSNKELEPKYRFPEFIGGDGWSLKSLGDATTKTDKRNKGGRSLPVYSISNKTGFTPQNEQFQGVDSEERGYDISLYKLIDQHTFAYNPARINIGSLGYSGSLRDIIISSLYVCFKTKPGIDDQFLLQFFYSSLFSKAVRNKVEGGIRSYLFYENFAEIQFPCPAQAEQQKIAEALTSFDELIAAEGRKLEALQQHKKGLLQQLFPRPERTENGKTIPAETTPPLRFPEFWDAPGWEDTEVFKVAPHVVAGGTPDTSKAEFWNGDIRWMNSGELNLKRVFEVQGRITESGLRNSSTRIVPQGSVLIGLAGQGRTRGTVAMNMVELCTNQSIAAILPNKEKFSEEFLYHELDRRYDELRRLSAGGEGRGGLNLQIIKSLPLSLPQCREQKIIASCLSSLDDLITAQVKKVELLKTHKRGLIQGLFPVLEDVTP